MNNDKIDQIVFRLCHHLNKSGFYYLHVLLHYQLKHLVSVFIALDYSFLNDQFEDPKLSTVVHETVFPVLERSVSTAPKTLPLSTRFFHFSNNVKRHHCLRKPFLKPHWFLENISLEDICLIMLQKFLIEFVKCLLACAFASHRFFLSFTVVSHLQI